MTIDAYVPVHAGVKGIAALKCDFLMMQIDSPASIISVVAGHTHDDACEVHIDAWMIHLEMDGSIPIENGKGTAANGDSCWLVLPPFRNIRCFSFMK
jgi:hypothetical protein